MNDQKLIGGYLNGVLQRIGGKKVEVSEDMLRELIDSNKELKRTVDQLSSNAVATSNNEGQ